ncbi:MAG: VOC family protein, partial [Actinobacteria bacterium]|nr:VOC family protein [Actinomycetota bacterium]
LEFYHCNARHHTLALIPAPMPKRMHHFMLQANTLDEVGFALDRAAKAGSGCMGSSPPARTVSGS